LAYLFKDAGVACQELVAQGAIETTVPAWTAEHGIDLIVTGTHGRKGVDRFFLGSTAETIFRTATCPVLTVGPNVKPSPNAEFTINKILFATSLTKESEPALSYALSFAQERNAKLTILHVVADDIEVHPDPRIAEELAWEKLRKLVPSEADLAHRPEFFVAEGDPSKKILDYAKREQPDLIILGLAKEKKTSTHFQRGIAYKVISSAPCAVLTIR
jgi:nucleotide-binding universal stress UspA family protein